MDSYSSISNQDRNTIRSDPSRMNNIDQTRLARLRPDKFDDVGIKDQISIIQQACGDVDPEIIALVFHECDHNMQQTIHRIRTGDFEDGGWQTAKSNNKKKTHNNNHNQGDQILNGGILSDSERSLSQRTSPTSSLRGGHRRNDPYQYPSSGRTDARRYGNDSRRNHFNPTNSRYSARTNPKNKSMPSSRATITSSQSIASETSLPSKQSNEEIIPQIISPSIDEYEFIDDPIQSVDFDDNQKKTSLQSSSKRGVLSSIPQEPVSMHPTVQFSTEPIDIQFGDVQWNNSVPIAVSPSNNTIASTTLDNHEQELSTTVNTHNYEQNQDVHDALSSNYINHHTTNEFDHQLLQTTDQLSSSLSITDNTIASNLPIVSPEGTSHLSDHLADTSSSIPLQYSSQQQVPIQIPITRLPPPSTPHIPEYPSPTSQFIPNNLQQTNTNMSSSAFTPLNTLNTYPSIPREYSQTTNWNPQSLNYKTAAKPTMIPTGNYQQQQTAYQLPHQQQQIILGTYPYPTLSPAVVQLFAPFEHWSPTGYSTSIESYPYQTANYIPAYSNQQQYHHPTKYDQHAYDKEFFAHYGQTRSSNNDISYQQQQQQQPSTPSQSTKETHITSKLSPTAATFSQGAPLTASPSATALYLNPVAFPMPNYYPSMGGTTHQDRTLSYSSVDNRDNRNGASYSGTNNRTNYYHHGQQQQRTHNHNVSNSTRHLQQ